MEVAMNGVMNGVNVVKEEVKQEQDDDTLQRSPLLIASVIALSLGEAKKAAAALEQTGREIQRELMEEEEEEPQEVATNGEDG